MKKAVNKVILVLLTVVLLIGCAAPCAALAATAPPEYAIKSAVACVGKVFSTTLVAKNIAGLQSGSVIIEYDASVLSVSSSLASAFYTVTDGASGLQQPVSTDVMTNILSTNTVYEPKADGKGYISYSFMTQDRALASSDITRVKSTELILATLFFTVKSTAPVGKTTINIVNSSAEVGSRLFTPAVTAGTVTVYSNPITDYITGGTNSAGQYIGVAPTNDLSAATVISFGKTDTAGISPTAFSTASKVNYLKFTSPVIDNSAEKDLANPTEYPQAAFSNLTTLKSVSINLSKSNLSKSRFFTDDGVMYIRDVDASGNLLDTCKIYLIPYAHAATITLAANVTGFFNDNAICNKTQTYTYRHKTHVEDGGTVTKAATCTVNGERTYYCIFNSSEVVRTEEITKLGHKYSTKYTVDTPATCTEDGSESRHCTRCGAKYSKSIRAIPATGHSWGAWKKYTNNYHKRICENDETHTELQKHTWNAGTITTAATCTTDGVKTYKCSVCNGKKTEAIPATGHTWDSGVVTTAATTTAEGVKTYTCSVCGETKTEAIPKTLEKIAVTAENVNTGIKLTWKKDANADGYYIIRKTGTGSYETLQTIEGNTTLTYTDTAVSSGTQYTYGVRSYRGTEKGSFTSKIITFLSPITPTLENGKTGMTVTWKKVTGATGYYVYRKTGTGSYSTLIKIEDPDTLTYTDTTAKSGTQYTYCVRAYKSTTKGAYTAKTMTRLSAVTPTLANISSGVYIKWTKVTGATGYYVYRKAGSGSYSLVTKIADGATVTFTDTEVKDNNGTKYTYIVKAYKSSTMSAYTAKSIYRLTGVTISSATNSAAGKMTVNWEKNAKATGYQIQYADNSSYTDATIVTVKDAATLTKTIGSLTVGSGYYVHVRVYKTVSGVDYYSGWSASKKVTIAK